MRQYNLRLVASEKKVVRPATRICCDCKNEYPLTEEYFYRDHGWGGFQWKCKACKSKSNRKGKRNAV